MKLAGIVFIVTSAGSVGFRIAASLRKRCIMLRQLLQALQLLRNEIAFCGTPLPQAFALMAASCNGVLEKIFTAVAKEMDKQHWVTPLAAMEHGVHEGKEVLVEPILLELAAKLGKYDLDAQLQAIETARHRTEELLFQMEQERSNKSRTYETLGVCAGLAVAILLI